MRLYRLNLAGWLCQMIGTLFLFLDSVRIGVRLPREGVTLGDPPEFATWYYHMAPSIGFFLLLTGFALCGIALWASRPRQYLMPELRTPEGGYTMSTPAGQIPLGDPDRLARVWRYYQHADDLQHRRCHFFLLLQGALIAGFATLQDQGGPILSSFLAIFGIAYAILWGLLAHTVQSGMDPLNTALAEGDAIYAQYFRDVRRWPSVSGRRVLNIYLPVLTVLTWVVLTGTYWWRLLCR